MLKLLKNVNALAFPKVYVITRASRALAQDSIKRFSVLSQMLKNVNSLVAINNRRTIAPSLII